MNERSMSEARSALTEREGPDYCRRSGKDVNNHRMNAERPIAIVTGASRGIGAEYARALAGRGRDVLLVARDKARLDQLAEELRARHAVSVEVAVIDLAEPDAAHRLFSAARQFRPVADVLVNNAGFGYFGEFVDMPLARIQAMLRLHVNTVVESVRLFLPAMLERRRGAIINVSSVAGFLSLPYLAEYAATKAFLNAFSEALAEEVRDSGVLIQACCPGSTDTDFHATAGFRPRNPLGAQDPAEVVAVSLAA
ncbi:MAG: SDR family NAD(P)-dependent oxidoreductase, partial [Nitrospirales bacterium]